MSGVRPRPVWVQTPITYPPLVRCAAQGGLIRRWGDQPAAEMPTPLPPLQSPTGVFLTPQRLNDWRDVAVALIVSSACLLWYAITR
jgi:hypothetical protein